MLCQERKLNTSNAKTARGITAGKRYANYSALERKLIDDAIAAYDEYAGHVYIYEGEGEVGVGEIGARIEEHVRYTGNKPAIVIVDYMQLLATFDPRASDKQNMDKAVLELKRLSRKHKIPIISISSYNRQNYKAEANFAALKESGLIEYSSDCVIGLQLAGTGESGFNDTREKAKDPRSIELLILKNRQGQVGQKLLLSYYPRFNYFRMESKPKEA